VQLGIKTLPEALRIAQELDLDLVEVAAQANPPVCRIMDYHKFRFDEAQRARESRRKSTNVSLKEMKYRLKIGPGDFETKTRKVAGFLAEGHKVKITIMFRGREVERPQFGQEILNKIADNVTNVGKVESMPRLDGRNMVMVLSPDKRAQAAAKDHPPKDRPRETTVAETGPETNGPDVNGPEVNGPEINGPEVNGSETNGAGALGQPTESSDTEAGATSA
jgi:translation initiation factor IF-3